jgi:tetratricopeptide (TPR) repeat protein
MIAHDSARAAALAELRAPELHAMHDCIADALDVRGEHATADFHRSQGGDLERARAALERFASTEQALYAPDVMATLTQRLLQLWPQDHQPDARHATELCYIETLHRMGEYDRALAAAVEMLPQARSPGHAQDFSNRIARIRVARGETVAAFEALEATSQGGSTLEADVIRASAFAKDLRYLEALQTCERVAPAIRDDDTLQDELVDVHAAVLTVLGHLGDAKTLLNLAIERAQRRDAQRPLALFLSRLGNAYFYEGHMAEAETPLQQSYDLYRRLGDKIQQVRLLNSLAAVSAESGQLWKAHDLLRVALDLSRRLGEALTTFFVLGNLVELLASLGHFGESLQLANSAIDFVEGQAIPQSILPTLVSRAKLFAAIGAQVPCRNDVARAFAVGPEPLHRAQLAMILCELAFTQRDLETASGELAKSRIVLEEMGAHDEIVRAGLLEARLLLERGDASAALETAHVVTGRAKEMHLVAAAVEGDVLLAEIALDADPDSARLLAQAACDTARAMGMRELVWRARRVTARSSGMMGDLVQCVAGYDDCVHVLRQQCDELPADLADAYMDHPDRARVLVELAVVRDQLVAD